MVNGRAKRSPVTGWDRGPFGRPGRRPAAVVAARRTFGIRCVQSCDPCLPRRTGCIALRRPSGMIALGRHRALAQDAWNELAVRAVIEEIAADAIDQFDPDTFWPGHPSDDGVGDGNPSFYTGAAGVIWALDYLTSDRCDWRCRRFSPCSASAPGADNRRLRKQFACRLREAWLAAQGRHGCGASRHASRTHIEPG